MIGSDENVKCAAMLIAWIVDINHYDYLQNALKSHYSNFGDTV